MSNTTHKLQNLKINEIENLLLQNPNISENLDKEIIKLFYPDDKRFVRYYSGQKWRKEHPLIWKYIESRYDDFDNFKEVFYRLRNHIVNRPVCKQCGGRVKFNGVVFRDFCSVKCMRNNDNIKEQVKQTCLEKYGVKYAQQAESVKRKIEETNLQRYGVKCVTQNEMVKQKMINTCLKRYGVTNPGQSKVACAKRERTLQERFGVVNAFKSDVCKDKIKSAMKEKYGVENCAQSKEVQDKIKKTCLHRYGEISPFKSEKIKNKIKQTCLDRFGVKYASQSEEVKKRVKETCLERYGVEAPMQNEQIRNKSKETCLTHYGVENFSQSEEFKEYFRNHHDEIQRKAYITKKKNKTFNSSKQEDYVYSLLCSKYNIVFRQYRDNRYPYTCDFYIPELDLFIELNAHWTHGCKPFTASEKDLEKLEYWKNKHTKYYDIAIKVWTISDVNKRNMTYKNNLNYLEFWNVNEVEEWIKNKE